MEIKGFTDTEKNIFILGAGVSRFCNALTVPILSMYYIKLIDQQMFATVGVVAMAVAAILQTIMVNEKVRTYLSRHFTKMIFSDIIIFASISYFSINSPNVRMIGLTLIGVISGYILGTLISAFSNERMSGLELTNFSSKKSAYSLWAGLAGGLLSVYLIGRVDIEMIIAIDCIGNAVFGCADYLALKRVKA